MVLNWFKIWDCGGGVRCRGSFYRRVRAKFQLNRLVTLYARRINVETRRQLDFSSQGDAAARRHSAIRLRKCEPQMRSFDILTHALGQFREKLSNDVVRREPIGVFRFEI